MYILALDSSAKTASAALGCDRQIVASRTCEDGRRASETLLPMALDVLREGGITPAQVDAFAVTAGPGSFTGVRIAVSVAKGLAFPEDRPCVALSTLEVIAEALPYTDGILCAVMDARRNQVYNALFLRRQGVLCRLTPDSACSLEALGEQLRSVAQGAPVYLAGDGHELARAALQGQNLHLPRIPPAFCIQDARAACMVAARRVAAGCAVPSSSLHPVYLRRPQAERERAERLADQQDGNSVN